MGTFGNLSYSTTRPKYQGLPVEEIKNAGLALEKRYETAKNNFHLLEIAAATVPVLDEFKGIRQDAVNKIKNNMSGIIESGRYETAGALVSNLAKDFATDSNLNDAINATETFNKFQEQEQTRFVNGKIVQDDLNVNLAKERSKIGIDENTGKVKPVNPTPTPNYFDIPAELQKFLTSVNSNTNPLGITVGPEGYHQTGTKESITKERVLELGMDWIKSHTEARNYLKWKTDINTPDNISMADFASYLDNKLAGTNITDAEKNEVNTLLTNLNNLNPIDRNTAIKELYKSFNFDDTVYNLVKPQANAIAFEKSHISFLEDLRFKASLVKPSSTTVNVNTNPTPPGQNTLNNTIESPIDMKNFIQGVPQNLRVGFTGGAEPDRVMGVPIGDPTAYFGTDDAELLQKFNSWIYENNDDKLRQQVVNVLKDNYGLELPTVGTSSEDYTRYVDIYDNAYKSLAQTITGRGVTYQSAAALTTDPEENLKLLKANNALLVGDAATPGEMTKQKITVIDSAKTGVSKTMPYAEYVNTYLNTKDPKKISGTTSILGELTNGNPITPSGVLYNVGDDIIKDEYKKNGRTIQVIGSKLSNQDEAAKKGIFALSAPLYNVNHVSGTKTPLVHVTNIQALNFAGYKGYASDVQDRLQLDGTFTRTLLLYGKNPNTGTLDILNVPLPKEQLTKEQQNSGKIFYSNAVNLAPESNSGDGIIPIEALFGVQTSANTLNYIKTKF